MHRIAAVLNLLTQLNKLSSNNFIRHECQNGILGGCFFILFDGYESEAFCYCFFSILVIDSSVKSSGLFLKQRRK